MRIFLYGYLFLIVSFLCFNSVGLAAGDPEQGKVKADTCLGCHGIPTLTNIYPTYAGPKIGGQYENYIVAALKAYQSGERSHETMRAQASRLSEEDMSDISAYFESLQ